MAATIVAAIIMLLCTVGLLRDVHLPSRDVVSQRHHWKRAFAERWQEELGYGICALVAGSLFAASIKKLRKP